MPAAAKTASREMSGSNAGGPSTPASATSTATPGGPQPVADVGELGALGVERADQAARTWNRPGVRAIGLERNCVLCYR